jgi:4,5-dihydroxyphthalate decarboxylase
MHTTVIKAEIVDRYPWVPVSLLEAFNRAKHAAYKRMENPRIVPLAWFMHALEEQEEVFDSDPWAYGLGEANRKNVETLMRYSHEQGILEREISLKELFVETSQ